MDIESIIKNENGKFMFHGSCKKLSTLVPMQSMDSKGTSANIDNAVFVTNDFLCAVPYAFKDTIKENSKGLDWGFSISSDDSEIKMKMQNVRIDKNIKGYVYAFEKTEDMKNDPIGSKQYKSYRDIKVEYVIEVKYSDYEKYFEVENDLSKEK